MKNITCTTGTAQRSNMARPCQLGRKASLGRIGFCTCDQNLNLSCSQQRMLGEQDFNRCGSFITAPSRARCVIPCSAEAVLLRHHSALAEECPPRRGRFCFRAGLHQREHLPPRHVRCTHRGIRGLKKPCLFKVDVPSARVRSSLAAPATPSRREGSRLIGSLFLPTSQLHCARLIRWGQNQRPSCLLGLGFAIIR